MLAPLITRVLGRAAGAFHRIERVGPPLPSGPVLVVANHPNSLLDPLIIFRVSGRSTRPLAKAPLFRKAGVGLMLRALNGLPVYRRQDSDGDPDQMARNEDTFRAAIDALRAGEAVQIYPEGISHSEPSLQPLKTGAARIALQTEAEAGWGLGLHVVPIGLTYSRKTLFRGRCVAEVGEAIAVSSYREAYEADDQAAARTLTADIASRLGAVTLNLAEREDRTLIETAERLYASEKGLATWRERPELAERLPRLRAFAEALGWLRANDPARHARLERAVRRYHRRLTMLGAGGGEVPPEYGAGDVARYVVRESLVLVLTLVPGLLGIVAWAVPYQLTRLAVRRISPPGEDTIATYKLASALIAYPIWYGLLVSLAGWLGGGWWVLAVALGLPVAGAAAVYWKGRVERVAEDARLWLRLGGSERAGARAALDAERKRLVAEFDEVWAGMSEAKERGPGPLTAPSRPLTPPRPGPR